MKARRRAILEGGGRRPRHARIRGLAGLLAMSGPAALSLVILGCGNGGGTASSGGMEASVEEPVRFESGVGLMLAEETRMAMELETETAGTGRFRDTFHAVARSLGDREGGGVRLRAVAPADKIPAKDSEVQVVRRQGSGRWTGRLLDINRSLVQVSGDVELLIGVDLDERSEVAEADLAVQYPVSDERESVSAPASALIRAALGDFVYVDTGEGLLRRRVAVGQVVDGRAEIRSGLAAGERVVTRGSNALWILELAMVGGMSQLDSTGGEG